MRGEGGEGGETSERWLRGRIRILRPSAEASCFAAAETLLDVSDAAADGLATFCRFAGGSSCCSSFFSMIRTVLSIGGTLG